MNTDNNSKIISFIHCGDLHLGINPEHNQTRFNDFFKVFDDLVIYAINNKVNNILIAGDMFHIKTINSITLTKTINILKKAKENNIEVIVIEGNHDRAFYVDEVSWLHFLDNEGYIHLLDVDFSNNGCSINNMIESDNYRIIGMGYAGSATSKYLARLNEHIPYDNKANILLMHAAVDRMQGEGMGDIKKEDVLKLKDKITYLALGHIHYQYEVDDFAFNPGSLENLRTKDVLSGNKGFYHVRIETKTKAMDVKYVKSNNRRIVFYTLNCDNKEKTSDIEEAIKAISKDDLKAEENDIIYFILKGNTLFNPYLIELDKIKDYIMDKFKPLYVEVVNNIGDTNDEFEIEDGVDIDAIIENVLEEKIRYQYPDIKDPTKEARQMSLLSKKIKEKCELEDIFTQLVKARGDK